MMSDSFFINGATKSISRIAAWRQGAEETAKRHHKRRYRGVYQTEEEAILKHESL